MAAPPRLKLNPLPPAALVPEETAPWWPPAAAAAGLLALAALAALAARAWAVIARRRLLARLIDTGSEEFGFALEGREGLWTCGETSSGYGSRGF